jgi:hypothetical protein
VEVCHIKADTAGGSRDLDNLVLGRGGCNRQQGYEELNNFRSRVSANTRQATTSAIQKQHVEAVRVQVMSLSKQASKRCCVQRVKYKLQSLQRTRGAQQVLSQHFRS